MPPVLGAQSLNHWTTSPYGIFYFFFPHVSPCIFLCTKLCQCSPLCAYIWYLIFFSLYKFIRLSFYILSLQFFKGNYGVRWKPVCPAPICMASCLNVFMYVQGLSLWLAWQRIHLPCRRLTAGQTPGLRKSPGEGNGSPLQYSCLGNAMDREAWRAIVHGVARVRHD